MDDINYFKELFNSVRDYRKIVLSLFLFQNYEKLLKEIEFCKNDISRLNLEFKNIFLEEREDYLDYIKNEEESVIGKILNK